VGDLFFEAFHSAFVARAGHSVKRARVRRVQARYFSQEKAAGAVLCLPGGGAWARPPGN
jgi:hypothetical protein